VVVVISAAVVFAVGEAVDVEVNVVVVSDISPVVCVSPFAQNSQQTSLIVLSNVYLLLKQARKYCDFGITFQNQVFVDL